MRVITIQYAQTNLSRLIKKVSAGEEIIIARGEKPVAAWSPLANRRQSACRVR
jgi:antitoxin (DNA-binding transcriptional repressor) of toxin-antitoxin stability system